MAPAYPGPIVAAYSRLLTRLDTSRNLASGGYGLGLAIVQRVIAWHGGRAIVTDAPIGGARFTIRWPGFSAKKPETSGR
jgi:signal transduction histidine kinase